MGSTPIGRSVSTVTWLTCTPLLHSFSKSNHPRNRSFLLKSGLHSVNFLTDQVGRVSWLSRILLSILGLGSDSAPALVQSRTPPPAMMGLVNIPAMRNYH
ncbi:hypothetical protein FNV43_RR16492 [Rhamnella rubrinervis]|uniref:Uncharacterized protein n=1 Tax=Rhamnella rubrinervis TaxID=2594499 RepID=A0A8K0GYW0_9ROSA|nr:hypothetical protein FNV43_RR16492 [Rhamnella rubrinervis]